MGVERGGLEEAPVLLAEAAFSACEVGVGEEEERRIVGAGAPVKVEAGGAKVSANYQSAYAQPTLMECV